MPDGRIACIDFGVIGKLDRKITALAQALGDPGHSDGAGALGKNKAGKVDLPVAGCDRENGNG